MLSFFSPQIHELAQIYVQLNLISQILKNKIREFVAISNQNNPETGLFEIPILA
ncbi:hypothetical protein D3C87_757000 [compost metagenome]